MRLNGMPQHVTSRLPVLCRVHLTTPSREVSHRAQNRGAAGLTRQLRQPRLMDEMTSTRLDTDATHFRQPLDHAEHRSGFGGFRHLPQPGQPRLATLFAALGQRIEALALFGGQPISQPTMCFSTCVVAEVSAEPLKRGRRRGDNAAFAATPHDQFSQVNEPIILDRLM